MSDHTTLKELIEKRGQFTLDADDTVPMGDLMDVVNFVANEVGVTLKTTVLITGEGCKLLVWHEPEHIDSMLLREPAIDEHLEAQYDESQGEGIEFD